ncbi:MAG: hypothetical protein UY16_C0024G0007 [Candidatus Gottesmanbacteria bacterium GW2011_GWA2_47_9]|uniref:Glycosyltransferase RgtA/B/C/D-like domain-containing protein n=2 Tax=Microgenomates group TaxID=1794810 RepID=A0A0G0UX29_9BACT|nr:MAG: hypothetical protein UU42_C0005G0029 [Candidatus Woesebacteria bacterium GW2011_GWA1_41_13b]KKU87555.1 MAG: hypothetical protein UY16_C0024G0007 [Candidatus Gottesmanbacteria bacterium GW2011_GWA2_47_9]
MKKKIVVIIIAVLVICAGLFVRLWGIWQGGFAFTYDAGRDLLAIRDLVTGTKFSLIGPTSGQNGIFYGPWWYWLLAAPFAISSGDPAAIVSFIALAGVAAAGAAYIWGIKYRDGFFAAAFAGLLAVAQPLVSATTQLWSPDGIVPVMVAIIILWSRFASLSNIALLAFGFLLGLLDELEIVYGVVFMVGFFISYFVWQRKLFWSKKTLFIVAGILFTEIPRVLFELRHELLQTKTFINFLAKGGTLVMTPARLMARLDFLWDHVTDFLPGGDWIKILFVIGTFAIISSQWKHIAKNQRLFLYQLLTALGVFFVFMLFYGQDVWPYYLIGLPVIIVFLLSFAVSLVKRMVPASILATLILMLLFFTGKPVEFVTTLNNPFVGDAAVYRNQMEAMRYIYKEAGGSDFNVIAYTPPQIEYTWRYLSWWTKRGRGYGEVAEKQPLLFVIIEPDYGYPQRVREWLWARDDDGEVTKQLMFNSGIIVQTRKREIDVRQ